jgi:hypothetical protein
MLKRLLALLAVLACVVTFTLPVDMAFAQAKNPCSPEAQKAKNPCSPEAQKAKNPCNPGPQQANPGPQQTNPGPQQKQ